MSDRQAGDVAGAQGNNEGEMGTVTSRSQVELVERPSTWPRNGSGWSAGRSGRPGAQERCPRRAGTRHPPSCGSVANLTLGAYLLNGSKLATAAFIEARGSRRRPQELNESSAYAERSPPALCLVSSALFAHAIARAAPSGPCRRGHPFPVVLAGAVAGQDRYGSRTPCLLTALKGGNGGR